MASGVTKCLQPMHGSVAAGEFREPGYAAHKLSLVETKVF